MNIAAQAMQTRRPAIEECDAGLVKIVVPIFMDDAFLGAVGACGLLLDEGEVDTFLIDKITGIDEETAQELAAGVGTISSAGAELLAEDVTRQIISIVTAYKNKQQS
jgi:ligand-binding sensor protein